MANTTTAINFILLGASAIGCYVGACLLAAGQQIALVGRPRSLGPLALDGLSVTDLESFTAHLHAEQLSLAIFDSKQRSSNLHMHHI